jgi:hypothetical protein
MEALGSGFKRSASKASNVNKSKAVVSQNGGESATDNGSSLKKIPKITSNESDDSKKISSAQNYSNTTLSRVILLILEIKMKAIIIIIRS